MLSPQGDRNQHRALLRFARKMNFYATTLYRSGIFQQPLPIYLTPMTNLDDRNSDDLILDFSDQAVISNTITPQLFFTLHGYAGVAGIL